MALITFAHYPINPNPTHSATTGAAKEAALLSALKLLQAGFAVDAAFVEAATRSGNPGRAGCQFFPCTSIYKHAEINPGYPTTDTTTPP